MTDIHDLVFRQAFHDELGAASYIALDSSCVAIMLDAIEGRIRAKVKFIEIEEYAVPFHMVGVLYGVSSLADEGIASFVGFINEKYRNLRGITPIESSLV